MCTISYRFLKILEIYSYSLKNNMRLNKRFMIYWWNFLIEKILEIRFFAFLKCTVESIGRTEIWTDTFPIFLSLSFQQAKPIRKRMERYKMYFDTLYVKNSIAKLTFFSAITVWNIIFDIKVIFLHLITTTDKTNWYICFIKWIFKKIVKNKISP